MGTTKSGRVINTKGSGTSPSQYSIIHSNEGDFTKPQKKNDRLRLKGGGHGESNLELLRKYHIEYVFTGIYENGVRIGNIPDHKNNNARTGDSHSWFPENWSAKDIRHAGIQISNLKRNRGFSDSKILTGIYKGIKCCVMKTHGKIATIYPDVKQNCKLKKF